MSAVIKEMMVAAKQAPRMYFAPLRGMVRAVQEEVARVSDELTRREQKTPRHAASQREPKKPAS